MNTSGNLATAASSYPIHIMVGPPTSGLGIDITSKVPLESISIEESGTSDESLCNFAIIDKSLLYTALRGEWRIAVYHQGEVVFRGHISRPKAHIAAIYGEQAVTCRDVSALLDRQIIKSLNVRRKIESDKARIQWLFSLLGGQLAAEGLSNWSNTQVLNAELGTQWFPPRLTLRQAIERVLAAASDSANYYLDYTPSLHTYDRDNMETGWVAPKNVNTTPGVGEIAPEDLRVDWDTDGIVNGYYVQGRNAAGSGFYTDKDLDMPGPWSSTLFGNRFAYIQAPDADTYFKGRRVAKAALVDTRNPVPRGSFSTFVGVSDTRFRGGQLLLVTSPIHGLNGNGTDAGPWAGVDGGSYHKLQPLRIVSVTTRYINGTGDRIQEIEFGGRQIHRYQASIPT